MISQQEAFWCVVVMIISGGLGICWGWVLRFMEWSAYYGDREPSRWTFHVTSILFTVFFCAAVAWGLQFVHR